MRFAILLIVSLIIQCSNSRSALVDPFGGKSFWALQFRSSTTATTATPVPVAAVFGGSSAHAKVYLSTDIGYDFDIVDTTLNALENQIVNTEHQLFTTPLDVDGDGKVTFLILDIDDGAQPGGAFFAGYFDPLNQFPDVDVYEQTCTNNSTSCSRSNETEMLYLDVLPARVNTSQYLSTIAHEYQHLLHFSKDLRAASKSGKFVAEATWVNEGLSEVVSDIVGFGPQTNRLAQFSSSNANALISWNDSNPLTDYANSYVYFRFLVDAYGSDIISKVFNATATSAAGVNEALVAMNDSSLLANCGTKLNATNSSFDCSFRYMWAALFSITAANGDVGGNATSLLFTRPTKFSFQSSSLPQLPGNTPSSNVILSSYAAEVHSKSTAETPKLSTVGCVPATSCDISQFTLFYDASSSNRYVVYNHATKNAQINVTTAKISAEVTISQQKSGGAGACPTLRKHQAVAEKLWQNSL